MSALAPPTTRPSARGSASDEDLVRRVRAGDDAAFEELFLRHRTQVVGYARGLLGDRQHAEDAAQEAFVTALRRLRATDDPIELRPWLRTVVRNVCIDQWRRRDRRDEAAVEVERVLEAGGGGPAAATGGPERRADDRETLGHLVAAVGELPARQRRMFVQRELEGRSYDEIARLQNTTRSAVETGLFRARQTLGTSFRDLRSGERCRSTRALARVAAAGRIGLRDRRRLSAHVRGCSRCRREAAAIGVPKALLIPSRVGGAASLLPLPALRYAGLVIGGATPTGGPAVLVPSLLAGLGVALGGVGLVSELREAQSVKERTAPIRDARAAAPLPADPATAPLVPLVLPDRGPADTSAAGEGPRSGEERGADPDRGAGPTAAPGSSATTTSPGTVPAPASAPTPTGRGPVATSAAAGGGSGGAVGGAGAAAGEAVRGTGAAAAGAVSGVGAAAPATAPLTGPVAATVDQATSAVADGVGGATGAVGQGLPGGR